MIPFLGGIVGLYVFPRLIAPLYLKYERAVIGEARTVHSPPEHDPTALRVYAVRVWLVALFVVGVLSVVINYVDPHLFMTQEEYDMFVADVGDPRFAPPVSITLAGLLMPLALGLWGTAWAIQDAGLYLYVRVAPGQGEGGLLQPVWMRFADFLRGYSGVSSLLFVTSVFALFMATGESIESALFTLLIPMFAVVQCLPAYMVYTRLGRDFLLRGAEPLQQ